MIVFNHNIEFCDEPSLTGQHANSVLDTISVTRQKQRTNSTIWQDKTDWLDMSGQKARYTAEREFSSCLTDGLWGLEIKSVLAFQWRNNSGTIEYHPLENFSPERLQFWVLHTVLPIVLTLQQNYQFLHVGAVELKHKPILFSAASFGGKSTLTDYFLQQGHKLLSDDSLAIEHKNETFYAVPGYPFHRPHRQPEVLGIPVSNMATKLRSVQAVYILNKVAADSPVCITPVVGVDKFKAFHFTSFISFDFFKQRRFEFFTSMAKGTPAYRVNIPWKTERLNEVYNAIVANSTS